MCLPQFPELLADPAMRGRRAVDLPGGEAAEFVYVDAPAIAPDGFMMGSPVRTQRRGANDSQFHAVLTEGYWLQVTTVTHGQWAAVLRKDPGQFARGPRFPVEHLAYRDCLRFIEGLYELGIAARLPTETEWEFACRAGTTTRYNCGESICHAQARFGVPSSSPADSGAAEVASYPPNAWGLYDMHGNVLEWCEDYYDAYPVGCVVDPAGPKTGDSRVLRGGWWGARVEGISSANRWRTYLTPDGRLAKHYLTQRSGGMRLVLIEE